MCYEYPPLGGGGSQVVYGLSRQLVRMGHSVDLLTMGYKGLPANKQAKNFSLKRVPCVRSSRVICHSHEMLSYLCMALPIALKIANKKNFDIIHAHFIFPDGILAYLVSRLTGLPYLITAHGSDVPGFNPDRFITLHKILRPFWKTVVRSCRQVVCLSRFHELLLKNVMSEAKTVIIPNGFPAGRFNLDRQKGNKILVVTRMFKRKGVQHLLTAVDKMDLDNYEIHILGDGPYLNNLREQSRSITPLIRFHGYVKNNSKQFTDMLETSKIFVFPSESENFPVVLLEAMDAGMAIITTKATGCEEVVGDAALLTRPGDVEGIRRALLKYIHNPALCEQKVEMARRRLYENFSWEVVARKYINVYEDIINHRQ